MFFPPCVKADTASTFRKYMTDMNKIDKPKKLIDVNQFNELVSRLNHSVACKTISKKTAEQIIKDAANLLFKGRNIIEK